MAHLTTARAKPRRMSSGAASTAVNDLVRVLRATPCYEWPRLRQQGDHEMGLAFERAAELVRAEWSPEERLRQMQEALTEATANAAVARVKTVERTEADAVAPSYIEHVQRAAEAMQAAQALLPLVSAA